MARRLTQALFGGNRQGRRQRRKRGGFIKSLGGKIKDFAGADIFKKLRFERQHTWQGKRNLSGQNLEKHRIDVSQDENDAKIETESGN